jgi:hypothetical protein
MHRLSLSVGDNDIDDGERHARADSVLRLAGALRAAGLD